MGKIIAILPPLTFLFTFKKPRFTELNFVDLIIDQRPIFLITWKINYGYKLIIKPLNRYYKPFGSMLLSIPDNTTSIQLIAFNFWRSTKKTIHLKHIELDKEIVSYLIQTFQPVTSIELKPTNILVRNNRAIVTEKFTINVKPCKIYFRKMLKLIRENFIYP